MNIVIVNSDIFYAKSLKLLLEKKMEINSIRILRDFQLFFQNYSLESDVILFEVNLANIKSLEQLPKYYSLNKTKFIALINNIDNTLLLQAIKIGVSSVIIKSEKIEFIVDELNLVIRGRGSFPVNLINKMKDFLVYDEKEELYRLINIFGKNIYIKKEKQPKKII